MSGPIIAFRADASVTIGTGHVMRCLTLASALQEDGACCHFLCRDLPGHLAATIRSHGFTVHLLPAIDIAEDDGLTAHSRWLGVSGLHDARECRVVLDLISPDWLVLDHYALDATWEHAARPKGVRLMVLDDLADRPHDCDLLLDQTLGRTEQDYHDHVDDGTPLLIGPHYALLRLEFAAHRAESLSRRKPQRLAHILVSLGGVDRDDVTSQVLETLAACRLPADCRITVVLGSSAPAQEAVRHHAARMPVPTEVFVGVDNMAALMSEADVAIGAAGTTSWERCCLGLPTLIAVLAPNQAPSAEVLCATGAALGFGDPTNPTARLAAAVAAVANPGQLEAMSSAAAALVDGLGVRRVVAEMKAVGA